MLAAFGATAAQHARATELSGRNAHQEAFALFARAARAGNREAQCQLGRCYLAGRGVPPSIGEAMRWLKRAAEAGEAAALTQLAALALQGVAVPRSAGLFDDAGLAHALPCTDYAEAERWCRRAIAAGSGEAKALLAFVLTAGPADRRDEAAGEGLYREAAQAGWSRGQLGLAMSLLRHGAPESAELAVTMLRAAAGEGIAAAHYMLGVLAESGAAGPVDFAAAAASYKGAGELGHTGAQLRYGFALLHGRGVGIDVFTAETWLRRAALAGSASAAAVVGYLYAREGGDLPPNPVEAAMWLERAAEGGHAGAARILGHMHLLGTGIPRNTQNAVHWLRSAADNGDGRARADLVRLLLTRQLPLDDGQAVVAWLGDSAFGGDIAAQYDLGLCLVQGIGAGQDGIAGLGWLRRSAAGGYPDAVRMLAQLLEPA